MQPAAFHNATGAPFRNLTELRQLLAEKYPGAERKTQGCMATGIESLDAAEGGLRRGALTELTSTPANGALFMDRVLQRICENQSFAALVDAGGAFDPDSCEEAALSRLLWVRCKDAGLAVKAADLIVRDGNFPLLLLDFQIMPEAQLEKIPPSTWHRFQRLVEPTRLVFVVLTRKRTVESAQVRVTLSNRWTLQAQRLTRGELTAALQARVVLRRAAAASHHAAEPLPHTA